MLSRHAHALVIAAVLLLWIIAVIALWRSDVSHPRNQDDGEQHREQDDEEEDDAEVPLAA